MTVFVLSIGSGAEIYVHRSFPGAVTHGFARLEREGRRACSELDPRTGRSLLGFRRADGGLEVGAFIERQQVRST